jgi:predicted TIM-barrel fold metal-dependent hydrolase
MDLALDEIELGRKNGACGVLLRSFEGDRRITDPYFYPLYQKAADLDIPVCVHSGNGNLAFSQLMADGTNNRFAHSVAPMMGAFVDMLTMALPERFPGLRIGFLEAGSQWVPGLVREVARRHATIGTEGAILDETTAIAEKRIYIACRTDDDLPYVLHWTGGANLLIGTDFGHDDPAGEIDALLTLKKTARVDPEIVDNIMDANPRAFYGL